MANTRNKKRAYNCGTCGVLFFRYRRSAKRHNANPIRYCPICRLARQLPKRTPSKGYCPLLFKYCSGCEKVRPAGDFNWRRKTTVKGTVTRLRSRCNDCESVDRKRAYDALTDDQRDAKYATRRAYMKTPQGKVTERRCEKRRNQPGPRKDRRVVMQKAQHLQRYGITIEQYENMLKAQGGVCAICGGTQVGLDLGVDHCHETGKVRGLLCGQCNLAIGLLGENPKRIESAKRYVMKHLQAIAPKLPQQPLLTLLH